MTIEEVVGFLTMSWARMETALDMVIGHLYADFGGKTLHRSLPRSFKRKLEFFRDCFNKLPDLPEKERALRWADEIEKLAEGRHWCVHGFFFEPDESGAYAIERPIFDVPLMHDERSMKKDEIEALGVEALKYGLLLSVFVKATLLGESLSETPTPPQKPRRAFRKPPRKAASLSRK